MNNNLFEGLAEELAGIAKGQFKSDTQALTVFKRLFKNISILIEGLNFKYIEFESFEGLFDIKKVAKIEDDFTKIEGFYENKIFKDLLVSFYPILRLYYALRLYDQKLLLSKFYIKSGLSKEKEFENIKQEAEELKNKTEFDLVLNFAKQNRHKKVWRKLIPHYADIAKRFNCYHRRSGKINFSEVAKQIRSIVVFKPDYRTVLQALDRYKE